MCIPLQVEEIESTESQWGNLSVASKQRELLKKWKAQLKVCIWLFVIYYYFFFPL